MADLKDYISEVVEEKVTEIVAGNSEVLNQIKRSNEDRAKVKLLKEIIENNGRVDRTSKKIELKDLITSPEFVSYFPVVVQEMALEAMEPEYIITKMLEPMNIDSPSLVISMPIFGVVGQSLDVGEGTEYPELTIKAGGGYSTVTLGKAGVKVSITEETIKYSRFDIFGKAIKEAQKALARWKETKALKMLLGSAQTLATGGTGLDYNAQSNGGLTMDDIINQILKLLNAGFNADTIIMHPLAYPIFQFNSTLRNFFYQSQGQRGSLVNYPTFTGQPEQLAKGKKMEFEGWNIQSIEIPAGIIGKPLKLILSPFAPYTAPAGSTPAKADIIIADSQNMGYLVTEQLPTTEDFRDPERDIRHLKITERYAIAPKYEGKAIGVIKDVPVVKTYDIVPVYSKTIS